jgi:uncharacterized protein YbbC (DUF1343 family)
MNTVLTGLDQISVGPWRQTLKDRNLGLLANQASLDRHLTTAKDAIARTFPGQLKALFGPQHGYGGEDQDNMVETDHSADRALNIPVYSLYSETRDPSPQMLEPFDVLIIDLQDVGTRVYTFASTMLNCLKASAKHNKKVVVLDRPNPLGGERTEGNLLRPEWYSFVGPYRIPMRHGLTMGEMALMFNNELGLACDLEVIPLKGWHRHMVWDKTGLRWFLPSTNMPSSVTAAVYPGQIIFEGTNLSEGRGTCRPFEIFGAPYVAPAAVMSRLEKEALEGCHLQEYSFRPTFHKWKGELCRGFMIHIRDLEKFQPYYTSLALLKAILETHPDHFEWKSPPYEYEYDKRPIDLILGDGSITNGLSSGVPISQLRNQWQTELDDFRQWRKPYLLYK